MYRHSKSTPRCGSGRDEDGLSKNTVNACNKNAVEKVTLDRDLHLLDKERARLLRNIDKEAKLVRQHAKDRSPSPTSSSPSRIMSAAASNGRRQSTSDHNHNINNHKSAGGSRAGSGLSPRRASTASPSRSPSQSPSHSPRTSPLLSRRASTTTSHVGSGHSSSNGSKNNTPAARPDEHAIANAMQSLSTEELVLLQNLRATAVKVEHHDGVQNVPQIVVSDETDRPVSAASRAGSGTPPPPPPQPQQKGARVSPSLASQVSVPDDSGGGDEESALSSSLNLPKRRQRSNSMPGNVVLPSIFKPPQRRPSYCPSPPKTSMDNLDVVESPRARSSSFSGIVPVRRRGSISENWGSISERKRPEMGSVGMRRTSVDMGNILRDLAYGVQHTELMHSNDKSKAVSQKQWEELKNCRYLRMPSRENSSESIPEEK